MGFSPCLLRKGPYHGLGGRLRWAFPPACRGKGPLMLFQSSSMGFHPCLSRKIPFRAAFPSACRGKGHLMDLVRACDGLSPQPVEEKIISWTWCVLEIGFSPCLSRKRLSHGLGACLRWASPLCLSRKRPYHGLGVRLRWTFPLPVEEKAISWTWCALAMAFIPCLSKKNPFQGSPASPREAPKGPPKWPGSSRAKKLTFLF